MHPKQAIEAIEAGNVDAESIAEYLGLNRRHVNGQLKEMAESEDCPITRDRIGLAYEYSIVDTEPASIAVVDTDDEGRRIARDEQGRMAVVRNADWDDYLLEDVHEYIAHDGEWEQVNALVDARETTGMAHVVLGGPTGCGKTLLAQRIAFERGFPMFTIQGKYSLNEAKLLGSPSIAPDGTTVWVDGTLTKALLASADRPVVLLLDEVNRARPEAKSVLFSALDHRASVVLDGERGGEIIEGNAANLVVFSTMNEGHGHYVQDLDAAEKRRLGPRFDVDYLGVTYPDREAKLVADRTPISLTLSQMLVKVANEVRELAGDSESNVQAGIPTATLIEWAHTAWAYDRAGIADPVVEAASASVVRMFYSHASGRDRVENLISINLGGCPVDEEGAKTYRDDERVVYWCEHCDYEYESREGDEDLPTEIEKWGECPDCGTDVTRSKVSY